MTKLILTKTLSAATAVLLATFSVANADTLLSPAHYGDELDRCVSEVRAELDSPADTRMRHSVVNIAKSGAWYTFTIESEVLATDESVSMTANSECRANRFTTATQVKNFAVQAAQAQFAITQ